MELEVSKLQTHPKPYEISRLDSTGTTHYDSLQGSFWSDQKNSHNEVITTSLPGK